MVNYSIIQKGTLSINEDNKSGSLAQRRMSSVPVLQKAAPEEELPAQKAALPEEETIQKKPNNTGMPDNLKSGVENLSGFSMDDVKVHYNSSKPAQLQALAYAQGTDIHVASGQEHHLPHEAWHVVQQKQGRVQPTMQMKEGIAVNDDKGLESEADVMGEKAVLPSSENIQRYSSLNSIHLFNTIQLKKYVLRENGRIVVTEDSYKLKKDESFTTKQEYKQFLFEKYGPKKGLKVYAPTVQGTSPTDGKKKKKTTTFTKGGQLHDIDLNFRGMSVNNISNLDGEEESVFTVQNPDGKASAEKHIVDDDMDSPYLSFERSSLAVSAGKYAPKPVDEQNRPLGVHKLEGGFLKQDKSYTKESQELNKDRKHIGLVGGILPTTSDEDYSTPGKAEKLKVEKARDLAVADREVLVKPGKKGITRNNVPFLAKVKRVPQEYYVRHIKNQSPQKCLGFFNGLFYKLQLDSRSDTQFNFSFKFDPELERSDTESDGEMSDIEDLDLDFDENGLEYEGGDDVENDGVEEIETIPTKKTEKKVVEIKSKIPAEYLADAIREYIAQSQPIQELGAQNPGADDLLAMQEGKVETSSTVETGEKKKKTSVLESDWQIVDHGGGGDCLFRSLNASNDLVMANTLRSEVVLYQHDHNLIGQGLVDAELSSMLRQSPHRELNRLEESTQGRQNFPVNAYYRLMAFQGTWAGRSEISAFSAMRNTTVYVMESTGLITRYAGGQGTNIDTLPLDAFDGGNIVLYKTNNHWRRVIGPSQN